MLFGKEAAGFLVETDSNDIQREIINAALEGKAFRNAGKAVQRLSILTNGSERETLISISPSGSPVAASPIILTAIEVPSGEIYQLSLLPGFEPLPMKVKRKRTK